MAANPPRKILLVGPYGLGSAVMALPAVQALRSSGSYRIDIACLLPSTERLCRDVPSVRGLFDEVYALHTGHGSGALARTIWSIRKRRYDCAVLLFPSAKPHYNLANFALGARIRVGSRFLNQPWWHAYWLNHRVVPVDPHLHDCKQNLRLIGAGVDVELSEQPDEAVRRRSSSSNLIGIHAGCKADYHFKRWGVGNFVEAARLLAAADPSLKFRFFFGPDELDELESFKRIVEAGAYGQLAPKVELSISDPLPQLFERIAECTAMIANDSGMMHIAAAQQVRTLGIFGPSDERRNAPYGPQCSVLRTNIPCRPCALTNDIRARKFHCIHDQRYCLTEIEPRHVVDWYLGKLVNPVLPSKDHP